MVVGFTVIVKVSGIPVHPLAVGVTVIVAITGVVPVFVAGKEGIFPVPLAARPIDGVSLVHAKVEPATGLTMVIAGVVAPLQCVLLLIGFTVDVGYTENIKALSVPVHPFAVGVIAITALTVAVPVLVAMNEGMDPVPLAARPIDGMLFVHAKLVPATGLLGTIAVVTSPLQ